MTVFVPSNEALRKIPDEELDIIKNNNTALKGKSKTLSSGKAAAQQEKLWTMSTSGQFSPATLAANIIINCWQSFVTASKEENQEMRLTISGGNWKTATTHLKRPRFAQIHLTSFCLLFLLSLFLFLSCDEMLLVVSITFQKRGSAPF